MQIVIDIDDNLYTRLFDNGENNVTDMCKACDAIRKGTTVENYSIRNEMTIVHHWKKDELEKVREDAIKVFSQIVRQDIGVAEYIESMISPIMNTYMNLEYTFVINGDCSKIGWETSKRFHEARMEWCEKHKHDVQNIIVINFGEGDGSCYMVFDNK